MKLKDMPIGTKVQGTDLDSGEQRIFEFIGIVAAFVDKEKGQLVLENNIEKELPTIDGPTDTRH